MHFFKNTVQVIRRKFWSSKNIQSEKKERTLFSKCEADKVLQLFEMINFDLVFVLVAEC